MEIRESIAKFLFPPRCPICNSLMPFETKDIAHTPCLESLVFGTYVFPHKIDGGRYMDTVHSVFSYSGKTSDFIRVFKARMNVHSIRLVREILIESLKQDFFDGVDMLVPVPMYKNREKAKGYNHSLTVAEILAQITGKPVYNAMAAHTFRRPQKEVPYALRAENVRDCFAVYDKNLLNAKAILLIDDIYTTGNTMNECSKVLRECGAVTVKGFALASLSTVILY
ncbi:hypothetical protein AGMMS49975_05130 [Clostridia bacterium]|nr:hypothetical protein AGMMS49975_05130 [Clostridia bacterium]